MLNIPTAIIRTSDLDNSDGHHLTAMTSAILVINALLLVARAGGEVSTKAYQQSDSDSFFTYAAANRDLKTVIIGNPFGSSKTEADHAIVAAMQGIDRGANTHYTTSPSANARTDYRMVIAFNPPRNMTEDDICGDTSNIAGTTSSSSLTILGGFCAEDELLTHVTVRIPQPSSPQSKSFANTIANLTHRIVPDPNHRSDLNRE